MRIYSDTLLDDDLINSVANAELDGVYVAVADERTARKRAKRFTVHLTSNNKGSAETKRRRASYGRPGYTATWDEHGKWLAKLYTIDPNAVIETLGDKYNSATEFHFKTHHKYY